MVKPTKIEKSRINSRINNRTKNKQIEEDVLKFIEDKIKRREIPKININELKLRYTPKEIEYFKKIFKEKLKRYLE